MPTINWIGKEKIVNHHLDIPYHTLDLKYTFDAADGTNFPKAQSFREVEEVEVREVAQKDGNKIIHADNLLALKSLLPEYEGRIKCIYIDPPYNTGEEGWVYNDNVSDPKLKKWLGQVVGKESEDLSRHDKWLCMMYPRLKLLYKLLSDGGAVFISIDDNEYSHLKLMCDEIFGNLNFITNFIWEKRTNRENRKEVSYRHDYILAYRKNKSSTNSQIKQLEMSGEALERYKNPDNDSRGDWKSDPATAQSGHATKSQFYTLKAPNGKEHNPQSGRCWVYNEDVMLEAINDNRIWFGKDGNGVPRIKTFLNTKGRGLVPETIWFASDIGTNESAKVDIKNMFNGNSVFQTPKPQRLIERILQISTDKDSIILDSFAGSGTTAHAVLNLNKQDGGNRKFILIELEDYAETITAERVKRVMQGYGNTEGTGGSFSYYTMGERVLDDKGNLNPHISLQKIHGYIWYSEIHQPYLNQATEAGYLGKCNNTGIYFHYLTDDITKLDDAYLVNVKEPCEQYIIYADLCLLPEKTLLQHNIIFKKIPRDISKL